MRKTSLVLDFKFYFLQKLILSLLLICLLCFTITTPSNAEILSAQQPVAKAQGSTRFAFQPPVLLGLEIHAENPMLFDFIVDQGETNLSTDELKSETEKLVKYFLAALTIPDKEVWVNLSPTEKDRIIPDVLGQTTMGKTMLEQDYVLKQLAASLTNPETDLGKKYWANVGNGLKPFPTTETSEIALNKVWIMPDKAEVLESNGIVLVGEKRLKVLMAEEYGGGNKEAQTTSSQIFRTTILPEINRQVNESRDFADVRQIYNSVILAAWYKKALKESLLGKVYVDKGKVAGVETDDKEMKQRIYEQYLAAFKKGAYNLIKEEQDENGDVIPRKYFSGGAEFSGVSSSVLVINPVQFSVVQDGVLAGRNRRARVRLERAQKDILSRDDFSYEVRKLSEAVHQTSRWNNPAWQTGNANAVMAVDLILDFVNRTLKMNFKYNEVWDGGRLEGSQLPRRAPVVETDMTLFGVKIGISRLKQGSAFPTANYAPAGSNGYAYTVEEVATIEEKTIYKIIEAAKTLAFASSSVEVAENRGDVSLAGRDSSYGGIDFDATSIDLLIKRDTKGIPLPLSQENLELMNIDGFVPVVLQILPVDSAINF